jgi:hypothetical protein
VGGFVGVNYGHISDGYAAPNISDSPVDGDGGGQVVTTTGTTTGTITIPGGEIEVSNNLQPAGANGSSGTGALGDIAIGGFAGGNFGSIIDSGSEDVVDSGANIKGVGNVTVGYGSKATTEPEPAKFSAPLALDSVFVGGFVGLNGAGSSISASFSDPNAVVIDLMLEPTTPPTAAAPGTSYGLVGPGSSGGALVTSTGDITGGTGYSITGGFAGGNYGTIVTSFSSGDVNVSGTTSQSNSFYTGGFAGISSGGIADVYESGNVASTTTNSGGGPNDETGVVGGLVAQMNAGTVSYTYETGTVTGGTTRGGLVGVVAAGVVSRSFWDTTSNSTLAYSAGGTGAKGYPETSMASPNLQLDITPSTEATSIYHANAWNFTTIWIAPSSSGLPTLRNVPQP